MTKLDATIKIALIVIRRSNVEVLLIVSPLFLLFRELPILQLAFGS
jgi:hypothetical protein